MDRIHRRLAVSFLDFMHRNEAHIDYFSGLPGLGLYCSTKFAVRCGWKYLCQVNAES